MRVCVFVDGENFRHSLVDLFPSFNRDDYLPKNADWDNLFDWIVRSVDEEGKRIRSYWYVMKGVDYCPTYIPTFKAIEESEDRRDKFKYLLRKEEYRHNEFATLEQQPLIEKLKDISKDLVGEKTKMQKRCEGWGVIQDAIALKYQAIELRR